MSTLEVSNLNDGTTTVATTFVTNGSAKAWADTNAAGSAINASFNISSLTDVSTGVQSFNLTNSFSSSNFSVVFTPRGNINQCWCGTVTASSWRTQTYTGSAYEDQAVNTVAFGDLA
jgi:hypothetical protein